MVIRQSARPGYLRVWRSICRRCQGQTCSQGQIWPNNRHQASDAALEPCSRPWRICRQGRFEEQREGRGAASSSTLGFFGRWSAGERSRCLPLVGLASNLTISVLVPLLLCLVTLVPLMPTLPVPAEDSIAPSSAPIHSAADSPSPPLQNFALTRWLAVVLSNTRLGSRPRESPSIRMLSGAVKSTLDLRRVQSDAAESTLTYYNNPVIRNTLLDGMLKTPTEMLLIQT